LSGNLLDIFMHILQINTEKGWRGGERQTLLTVEALRGAGVTVTLLCRKNGALYKKAEAAGVNVVGVKGFFDSLWYIRFNGTKYDLVHAQTARGYNAALFGTLFSRLPVICGRRVAFAPHGGWGRWKYRRATAVVAVSQAVRNVLSEAGCVAEIISDMHEPVNPDPERVRQLRERYQLVGKRVVGVVAALTPEKDPLTMVHAALHVFERLPDVRFVHIGSGPLEREVRKEREDAGLTDVYLLHGCEPAAEALFGLFDVFTMSSLQEGLGSSVLDAFHHEVPVAATAAGGLAELIDGRGLLSTPGDPDRLGENIVTLLSDGALCRRYTIEAKRYLKEHHSRSVIVEQTLSLYRRVLSASGRAL
jgi:glycosyltransferase involved in cell wall biosynthesis